MNRAARRRQEAAAKKAPPKPLGEGPTRRVDARAVLGALLKSAGEALPGYHTTIFISEKAGIDGKAPRYNVVTNATAMHVMEMISAFVDKQAAVAEAKAMEKANGAPEVSGSQG